MAETLTPDICVIGTGPGGLAAVKGAAAYGASTVLVEPDQAGGVGDAGLRRHALLAAASRANLARHAQEFGIKTSGLAVDFAAVRRHLDETVAALAPNDTAARLAGLNVRVVRGAAAFTDARTVAVGEAFSIRARRFIIAAGATPAAQPSPVLPMGPSSTARRSSP